MSNITKVFCFLLVMFLLGTALGQETAITLPTSAASSSFNVYNNTPTNLLKINGDGHVGIAQTNPRAHLEVGGYNGVLATGQINSGSVLAVGSGARMHWYPRTAAFRAGVAETNWWDDDGTANPRLALYSIAMGYMPRASAAYSVAIGRQVYATGQSALALGAYSHATSDYTVAIGYDTWATGPHSVAFGAGGSTNGREGSMVIGDNTPFSRMYSSTDNELTMRFIGGYRLWTSYSDSMFGVYMRGGHSGWNNYCDRNIKENFESLDGEVLLGKIQNLPISKWNYKNSDATIKYIGPMAQDFHAAFQLGGEDSLGINTICMDGVTIAGVQALIKRTGLQTDKIAKMDDELTKVREENLFLRNKLSGLEQQHKEMQALVVQMAKDKDLALK